MKDSPRITVGIPVYNGAANLPMAMESVLAQTYDDFELVVADNASTDATADIVAGFARADRRVRHVRHHENIGANSNYSFLARTARGEFLKWMSSSDWCAPTFLERCVQALDADPGAVLAVPRSRLFAHDPSIAEDYHADIDAVDPEPFLRFIRVQEDLRLNNAINGLIRVAPLLRTPLIRPYFGADMVMMAHLAVLGRFLLLEERLLYRRNEKNTTITTQDLDSVRRHHYPTMGTGVLFQRWKRHAGWFRVAATAPMPLDQRVRMLGRATRRAFWDRAVLVRDVGVALRFLATPRSSAAES